MDAITETKEQIAIRNTNITNVAILFVVALLLYFTISKGAAFVLVFVSGFFVYRILLAQMEIGNIETARKLVADEQSNPSQ